MSPFNVADVSWAQLTSPRRKRAVTNALLAQRQVHIVGSRTGETCRPKFNLDGLIDAFFARDVDKFEPLNTLPSG